MQYTHAGHCSSLAQEGLEPPLDERGEGKLELEEGTDFDTASCLGHVDPERNLSAFNDDDDGVGENGRCDDDNGSNSDDRGGDKVISGLEIIPETLGERRNVNDDFNAWCGLNAEKEDGSNNVDAAKHEGVIKEDTDDNNSKGLDDCCITLLSLRHRCDLKSVRKMCSTEKFVNVLDI